MKKTLLVAAMMLLLTGCGGKETKTVCKSTLSEGIKVTQELTATGDKVTKTTETGEMDFNGSDSATEILDSDIEEMGKLLEKTYDGLDGVEFKYDVKDKVLTYTASYDYEKADLEELQKKELITFEKDGKVKYIGLKTTVDSLKKQGATCNEEK